MHECQANLETGQHAVCADVPDTYENLYAFFIGRVRDRLHVVLCFSPVGATFARRAQQVCDADWVFRSPTHGCGTSTRAAGLLLSLMRWRTAAFEQPLLLIMQLIMHTAAEGGHAANYPVTVIYPEFMLLHTVPWTGQWRHDRLVPPVAGGGAHGCCRQIYRLLQYGLHRPGQYHLPAR